MITDPSQRFVLAAFEDRLIRYDSRWRTQQGVPVETRADQSLGFVEGDAAIAAVRQSDAEVVVTIHEALFPDDPRAQARFDGERWTFEGERELWRWIPEYLLLDEPFGKGLLRIADDAEVDPLTAVKDVESVVHLPESRLLVLVGGGGWSIYDPIARNLFARHELKDGNPHARAAFRNVEELWINDVDTMLKIDAKKFEVLDAAGSEAHPRILADGTSAENPGTFGPWTFVAHGELCLITRPILGDTLLIDAMTMTPVAQATFSFGRPIDATLIKRNIVVALSTDGSIRRARCRKVKVPVFDGPPSV